jgi:nicotinamide mononucleotide transporter
MLKDWTLFEKIWIVVFTAINLFLFFAWDDTLLGLITSISGMLCVVLVAKGKISNYYFGMVQVGVYTYIAFTYQLYGEAMLNGLFYLPVQFIGLWMWNRNKIRNKDSVVGEEIEVKKLSKKQWIYVAGSIVVATIVYAIFLQIIGGRSVGLDSATNILSITAQILMLYRFAEQWLMWIAVNVLSIAMWGIALATTGGNDWTILVMWTAFLVNSVYGYVNWIKMHKKQAVSWEEKEND